MEKFAFNSHQTFVKPNTHYPPTPSRAYNSKIIPKIVDKLNNTSQFSQIKDFAEHDQVVLLKDFLFKQSGQYETEDYTESIYKLLMALPSHNYCRDFDNSVNLMSSGMTNSISNLKTCKEPSLLDEEDDPCTVFSNYSNFYFKCKGKIPDDYLSSKVVMLDAKISSYLKYLEEKQLIDLNYNLITQKLSRLQSYRTRKDLNQAVSIDTLDPVLDLLHQTLIPSLTKTQNYSPRFRPSVLDQLRTKYVTLKTDFVIFENEFQTCLNNPLLLVNVTNHSSLTESINTEQLFSSRLFQNLLNKLHVQCLAYETNTIMVCNGTEVTLFEFIYDNKDVEFIDCEVSGTNEQVSHITVDFRYKTIKPNDFGLSINWAIASTIYNSYLRTHNHFEKNELINNIDCHVQKLMKAINMVHTSTKTLENETYNIKIITEKFDFKHLSQKKISFTTIIRLRTIDYIKLFNVLAPVNSKIDYVVIKILDFNKIKDYYWINMRTTSSSYQDFFNWCIKCHKNEIEAYRRITQYNNYISLSNIRFKQRSVHSPKFIDSGLCSIDNFNLKTEGCYLVLEYLDFVKIKPNSRTKLEKVIPEIRRLNKLGIDHRDQSLRNMCYNENEDCVYVYDFNIVELTDSYEFKNDKDNDDSVFSGNCSLRYERGRKKSLSFSSI